MSNGLLDGPIASVKAAITSTPGAVTSGCNWNCSLGIKQKNKCDSLWRSQRLTSEAELTLSTAGSILLGPLDENLAIAGLGFTPKFVIAGLIDAVGFLFQLA